MSDEKITIKVAESQDAAKLIALLKELENESDKFSVDVDLDSVSIDHEAEAIKQINRSGQGIIILAVSSQQLVGLVTVDGKSNGNGEIGIAVLDEFQSMGLGTALLHSAIEWEEDYSILTGLQLSVLKSNRKAYALYLKNGFVVSAVDKQKYNMIYQKKR